MGGFSQHLDGFRPKIFSHALEYYIQAKFEVFENFRVDVILGDDILFQADVYNKCSHLFRHNKIDA
jgi:hypothetical protein